jgi:hypothetical protein
MVALNNEIEELASSSSQKNSLYQLRAAIEAQMEIAKRYKNSKVAGLSARLSNSIRKKDRSSQGSFVLRMFSKGALTFGENGSDCRKRSRKATL